ncbi:MAG TPA: MFS transporter [Blastocatellia bacterium]|nr:MFS transporter [Blastocatellia bacterium]
MYQVEQSQKQSDDHKPEQQDRIYYGWVIVTVCFLVMTLIGPMLASFSVFYVAILEDMKWSRADTALALSFYFIVSGLASPVAGDLVDRYGPRVVMPLGALITAGAFLWISQMSEPWHFYAAFGIIGSLGATMLNIVPLTTVISNWFVRNRGLAIGLVTGGQGLGQVGIPAIQYLINNIGWRNTYIVLGAIILTIPSTLILLFLHRRPSDRGFSIDDEARPLRFRKPKSDAFKEQGRTTNEKGEGRKREIVVVDKEWAETNWTIASAARTGRFWILIAAMILYSVAFIVLNVQIVAYLKDEGYSDTLAASAVGFEGFINIIGRFVGGGLSDRIGREKALTLGIAAVLISILFLALAGLTTNPIFPYLFGAFYGLGNGIALPAFMAATADLFQGKHFGSILGITTLGGYLGGALGAWLSGYLIDVTQAYRLNFLVAAVAMALTIVLIWKVRPGRVRYIKTV